MKKIFSMIFMAAMMLSMTSCLNGTGNSESTQSFTATMYNRVIDGDNVALDQSVYNCVISYTNGTMTITGAVVVDGKSVTFTTDAMTLTYSSDYNAYGFKASSFTNVTNGTVSSLTGYYDLNTSALYVQYSVNGQMVCATATLYFPHTSTYAYSPDSVAKDEFSSVKSQCQISLATTTEKTGTVLISDFAFDSNTASNAITVSIPNVAYTLTPNGYVFAADEVTATSTDKSHSYKLTDFKVNVTNQGMNATVTYKHEGRDVTVTCKEFAPATSN